MFIDARPALLCFLRLSTFMFLLLRSSISLLFSGNLYTVLLNSSNKTFGIWKFKINSN